VKKQELLDLIDQLPNDVDPEQLIQKLYLKAKLERAEAAVANGDVVPQREVVKRSDEWFL
jgi:hypothetical protein